MVAELILINGLPAAGKTTLATALAAHLGLPMISKDRIKESLADISGSLVNSGSLGALASETLWGLTALIPGRVIVESWWFGPRDLGFVEAALERMGHPHAVEIWCDIEPQLAWARYLSRERHPIHPQGPESFAVWAPWLNNPLPLAICPVVRVRTSEPVDIHSLAGDVDKAFARQALR